MTDYHPEDILKNGKLYNLKNYKIFKKRAPTTILNKNPIEIKNWYLKIIKNNINWVVLCGNINNKQIQTSFIVDVFKDIVKTENNSYLLKGRSKFVLPHPDFDIKILNFFKDGFPVNWRILILNEIKRIEFFNKKENHNNCGFENNILEKNNASKYSYNDNREINDGMDFNDHCENNFYSLNNSSCVDKCNEHNTEDKDDNRSISDNDDNKDDRSISDNDGMDDNRNISDNDGNKDNKEIINNGDIIEDINDNKDIIDGNKDNRDIVENKDINDNRDIIEDMEIIEDKDIIDCMKDSKGAINNRNIIEDSNSLLNKELSFLESEVTIIPIEKNKEEVHKENIEEVLKDDNDEWSIKKKFNIRKLNISKLNIKRENNVDDTVGRKNKRDEYLKNENKEENKLEVKKINRKMTIKNDNKRKKRTKRKTLLTLPKNFHII